MEPYIVDINGADCTDLHTLIDRIAEGFRFPDTFEPHIDTLQDYLSDLQWLADDGYNHFILRITDGDELLIKESAKHIGMFYQTLFMAPGHHKLHPDRRLEIVFA